MDSSHFAGPALVAAAADADPVTLLVLGWLAANRSENTRTAYARDIGITPPRRPGRAPSWLTWCQEQGVHPVTGVTMLHVTRYARQLEAAGLSPASAARKLAAISSWYDWLARRGHIPASPAAGLARPRPGPRTPPTPALTPDQALALMHAADTAPGPQRARTAALIAVLLYTGARLSEATGADVGDLGTSGGRRVLWVTRGNGRRQGLPLPGPAASRIDAYLAGRAGQVGVEALFATRTGRRLFYADVRQAVSRIATRAGLPADQARRLGPRMIRRSFTTLYLQASESLRGLHGSPGQPDPLTARRHEQVRHTPASHAHPAAPQPRKPPSQLHPGDQPRDPEPGPWPWSRPHCGARRPRHAPRRARPCLSRASSGGPPGRSPRCGDIAEGSIPGRPAAYPAHRGGAGHAGAGCPPPGPVRPAAQADAPGAPVATGRTLRRSTAGPCRNFLDHPPVGSAANSPNQDRRAYAVVNGLRCPLSCNVAARSLSSLASVVTSMFTVRLRRVPESVLTSAG